MSDKNPRLRRIRNCLISTLDPREITLRDDSAAHAGHAGAATGRGHFDLVIRAEAFIGKSRVARHQMVYAALGTLMQTDIHALAIRALAPEE